MVLFELSTLVLLCIIIRELRLMNKSNIEVLNDWDAENLEVEEEGSIFGK